ncbi:MAG: protoheme IX farnesyltransferase [Planctomycetota bacterium]|nr:protoheme IX farnesyltransferase [Planctomycetota bacterium]
MAAAPPTAMGESSVGEGSAVVRVVRLLLELGKARITFAVTFSVMTGWVLFTGSFAPALLVPVLGVFLLACGSATINQVQEWRVDARMERTRGRPIPSGRITATGALIIAVAFLAAGLNLLGFVQHNAMAVVGLGAFAVLYYNGIYYALKRLTAFAVVPGALIGAVPPILGWCAAGGHILDATILEVGAFFFIWQIPHFWLLVNIFGRQYESAGLPSATAVISPGQFQRITVAWSFMTSFCGLALVLTQGVGLPWNFLGLGASIAVGFAALAFLRGAATARDARRFFMQLNAYALAMMLLLMADALAG